MFTQDERKIYTRSYSINPEFTDGVKGVRLYLQISEVDDKMLLENGVKYLIEGFLGFDDYGMRDFIIGTPLYNVIEEWSEESLDKILQAELDTVTNYGEILNFVKEYQHMIAICEEYPFDNEEED